MDGCSIRPSKQAVGGISVAIPNAECFGLLGVNGGYNCYTVLFCVTQVGNLCILEIVYTMSILEPLARACGDAVCCRTEYTCIHTCFCIVNRTSNEMEPQRYAYFSITKLEFPVQDYQLLLHCISDG